MVESKMSSVRVIGWRKVAGVDDKTIGHVTIGL